MDMLWLVRIERFVCSARDANGPIESSSLDHFAPSTLCKVDGIWYGETALLQTSFDIRVLHPHLNALLTGHSNTREGM